MIDGNTAAALGCVYRRRHGRRVVSDHAVDLADGRLQGFCDRMRVDPETGRKNFAFIQAEDELAAIGMVIGAIVERRARVHRDLRARASR